MNKRGVVAIAILFAVIYFMVGMITYQLIKPDITIQRDSNHLNCSSPSTDGDRISCLLLDGIIPYLIIAVLSTAGGIITDQIK